MARKSKLLTKKNAKGVAGCLGLIGAGIYYFFRIFFYYPLYFIWKGILFLYYLILNLINEHKPNESDTSLNA